MKKDRKEYFKAYRQTHKEQLKANMKAWKESHKEQVKANKKAWYEAHKESQKVAKKDYYQVHKEEVKASNKAWKQAHNEEAKASMKAWRKAHREEYKAYQNSYQKAYYKSDLNSLGQTKSSIRKKSQLYLKKHGTKIPGYQIHHCFTYDDPTKFIYCSKEMHLQIHKFLRDNNIDADSNHYEQIKHLLDEKVVTFGL